MRLWYFSHDCFREAIHKWGFSLEGGSS